MSKSPVAGVIHVVPYPWATRRGGRQNIALRLSRHFPSVFLDPPWHWRENWISPDQPAATVPEAETYANLTVLRPRVPNIYRPRWLSELLFRARLARARRHLRLAGCHRIVLFVWHPQFAAATRLTAHDVCVYYVNDEYSTDENFRILGEEEDLLRTADLVFVHSPELMRLKGCYNPNTMSSPNGVDFKAFAAECAEPEDLRPIPRPRVGYAGVIKRQLDWDLIEAVADRNPNLSFVFLGPLGPHPEIRAALDRLSARDNVHFLGERKAADVPAYVTHFDVGIMPYSRTPYTDRIFPLKLNEYLASGLPIIATPIKSLESFSDVVELAETTEEWSRALTLMLAEDAHRLEAREFRREIARQYDWDVIVDRIAARLRTVLDPGRNDA